MGPCVLVSVHMCVCYRGMNLVVCKGAHRFLCCVCLWVCMNVQRKVSAVHACLCAGVSTLKVCVCAVSPFMCQCWSLGIGVVSVHTCRAICMHVLVSLARG